MKRIISILAVTCIITFANAQSIVDETFGRFSGKDGFTTIKINPFIFKMVSLLDSKDKELKEITDKIHSFKLLISEDKVVGFTNELREKMKTNNYVNIMAIVEAKSKVDFYVQKDGETITDFVLLVTEADEEVMLSMSGKFSLVDLAKFGSSTSMNGQCSQLSYLQKLEK